MCHSRCASLGAFLAGLSVLPLAVASAAPPAAAAGDDLAARIGAKRGICVVLEDRNCERALRLAGGTELTVFVQLRDAADAEAACRAADEAGLYGRRIFIARGQPSRIGLANDLADAVIVPADLAEAAGAEALRVVRPGGKVILGGRESIKPWPEGVDDWTHVYHGPDNNTQSADRLARSPYLTQFIAEPRYAPAPQAAVAAAGRLFMAFGHVAWHRREEPAMNTLIAVNAFNGTLLWKRPLAKGGMVDRNTMIATADALYLAEGPSLKRLDPATGAELGEIPMPADLGGGRHWKWLALDGGVLYALVGPEEKPDEEARWARRAHGWPWGEISQGYNQQEHPWGFGDTLLAMKGDGSKVIWRHQEQAGPIDSRSLCMKAGRLFLSSFGKYLACLDTAGGSEIWRKTPEKDAELFKALGPWKPGHGYRTGWKTTIYARCTSDALYMMGPQLDKLAAVGASDGKLLWSLPANINVHIVVRDDGVYTVGGQDVKGQTRRVDAKTGEVLSSFEVWRRACTRTTGGPDGLLFRAAEGTCRLDLATGKPQWISPMRPSCNVGVVIAGGHLYWVPWGCDCNLQLFGVMSCGPAGDFAFGKAADPAERLESLAEPAKRPAPEAGAAEKAPAERPVRPAAVRPAAMRRRPGEWSTYLGNNARSVAATGWPIQAPEAVELAWRWQPQPAVEPTAPTVSGNLAYVADRAGVVRALRLGDGKEQWRAYVGGAVLYPPTIDGGKAFVGAGDGWAYCLDAGSGKLRWRFRAAPQERRISVFGRLQSAWPVASGVLVEHGTAYFAAGFTDYDGTHVYALDANTGEIRWQNNDSGQLDAFSRRGVSVQGHLLAFDGKLYLAGGNCVSPGVYDMATGKCSSPPPEGMGTRAPRGQEMRIGRGGNVEVSGQPLYSDPASPVFDGSVRWTPMAFSTANADLAILPGSAGTPWRVVATDPFEHAQLWSIDLPGPLIRWGIALDAAGRIILTCRDGSILCYSRAIKGQRP